MDLKQRLWELLRLDTAYKIATIWAAVFVVVGAFIGFEQFKSVQKPEIKISIKEFPSLDDVQIRESIANLSEAAKYELVINILDEVMFRVGENSGSIDYHQQRRTILSTGENLQKVLVNMNSAFNPTIPFPIRPPAGEMVPFLNRIFSGQEIPGYASTLANADMVSVLMKDGAESAILIFKEAEDVQGFINVENRGSLTARSVRVDIAGIEKDFGEMPPTAHKQETYERKGWKTPAGGITATWTEDISETPTDPLLVLRWTLVSLIILTSIFYIRFVIFGSSSAK